MEELTKKYYKYFYKLSNIKIQYGGNLMIIDDVYDYKNKYDFISDFKKGKIHYPVKRIYKSSEDIHRMMDELKKYNIYENNRLTISDTPYQIYKINLSDDKLLFNDKYTLIINKDEDYDKFEILSDMFLEDLRVNCSIMNTKNTSYNYFHKNYKYIAFEIYKKYNKITPYLIREFLWNKIVECTSFKPNVLIAIKQILYTNKENNDFEILDPSSGWGDRLIGAIAMNVKYTGIDPNRKLHPRYNNIINFFNKTEDKYTMICSPFEECKLNKKFDFIFTSPPYFNLEIYSSEDNQSVNAERNNEKQWFDLFFKKYLSNAWEHLKNNCFMAININQKNKNESYINWMINYVNSFDDSEFRGIISYKGEKSKNPQPIFIWMKK